MRSNLKVLCFRWSSMYVTAPMRGQRMTFVWSLKKLIWKNSYNDLNKLYRKFYKKTLGTIICETRVIFRRREIITCRVPFVKCITTALDVLNQVFRAGMRESSSRSFNSMFAPALSRCSCNFNLKYINGSAKETKRSRHFTTGF